MRLLLVLSVLLGVVSAGTGPKKSPNLYKIQEEFQKNQDIFTWTVRQMSKSGSWAVGVKCDECLRFLKYMQGFATNTEAFISRGKEMCGMITRAKVDWKVEELCLESVERYGQAMAHILRNMNPVGESEGAQLFCNTWLGTCPAVRLRYNVPMNYTRNEMPPRRPKPSGQMPFKFVHFSDLHLDPHYFAGTQSQTDKCPYPLICCRAFTEKERDIIFQPRHKAHLDIMIDPELNIGGPYGHHGACDTPHRLQQSFYRAMKKFAGDADFAIFTGGILSRQIWNSTAELNIGQIEKAYSNMSELYDYIYPAVGNDESSPANLFQAEQVTSKVSTQWLYDTLASLWARWIGDKDARRVKDGGFYSTKVPHRNLRIISLNTNLYNYKNLWVYQDPINHDPAGQLAWLVSELDAATLAKEHVYIIGHMSMGDPDILQHYSRSLNQIMNKYGSTVAAMFFGHTYLNQFQLHYRGFTDPQSPHWWRVGERLTAEDALVTSYIAPSITPVVGAPAFNVFYVDPETFGILDIVTYSSNMVDRYWEYDKGPKWARAYSAKVVYGIPQKLPVGGELSPAFWHKVSERFDWDRTFYRLYFGRQTAWNEKQTGESQRAKDQCFIRGGIARDCLGIPGRGGLGGYLGITDG
ncbi:hypothetical protein H634G_02166 [Metarhizium anisopliae BRIP 53293]|uniref:Saposin B-type domain-containing protein n=1 Tax=Metarhizium anisopliae BRIP 53293 TaxID=1291518 RepID=A0A0D9PCP7_METAN|nr:hypothetical protein H634G_02166 [Metarhizium anisopliae BRIP 53293]KJK86461.1 hypothetical protein H633G_09677 [Metarhizium anisopliae BRIP 53284]